MFTNVYIHPVTSDRSPGTAARFSNAYKRSGDSGGEIASLRLSPELAAEVRAVGDKEGLSQSDTLRLLVRRGLTATNKKLSDDAAAPIVEQLMSIVDSLQNKEQK